VIPNKSLSKQAAEHKDVMKISLQLNSMILSLRGEVTNLLNSFNHFYELWKTVRLFTRSSFNGKDVLNRNFEIS